jgi:hypothetical protein
MVILEDDNILSLDKMLGGSPAMSSMGFKVIIWRTYFFFSGFALAHSEHG